VWLSRGSDLHDLVAVPLEPENFNCDVVPKENFGLLYLSLSVQLTVFLIKLYMFPSSDSEFILFILLTRLLAPSDIPFFSNISIEVFDALVQLLVSVL
jgi:hypothetical protein